MEFWRRLSALLICGSVLSAGSGTVPAADAIASEPDDAVLDRLEEQPVVYNLAPVVFQGRITEVARGPVLRSDPPRHVTYLQFEILQALRGRPPKGPYEHTAVQQLPLSYVVGSEVLVAAGESPGERPAILRIDDATEEAVESARKYALVPVGWRFDGGQPVSPWAKLGKEYWPEDAGVEGSPICSVTGRPALFAGEGITLTAEPVPPDQAREGFNDYGDGQFRITVTNRSRQKQEVAALLTANGRIRWADSLIVLHSRSSFLLPEVGSGLERVRPAVLRPGESVSTTVDVSGIEGIQWPQGASRQFFRFCLGELSAETFFYFHSGFHSARWGR